MSPLTLNPDTVNSLYNQINSTHTYMRQTNRNIPYSLSYITAWLVQVVTYVSKFLVRSVLLFFSIVKSRWLQFRWLYCVIVSGVILNKEYNQLSTKNAPLMPHNIHCLWNFVFHVSFLMSCGVIYGLVVTLSMPSHITLSLSLLAISYTTHLKFIISMMHFYIQLIWYDLELCFLSPVVGRL